MGKIDTGASCFSAGPIMDTTPRPDFSGQTPRMSESIPSCTPQMGALNDSVYSGIAEYGIPSADGEARKE